MGRAQYSLLAFCIALFVTFTFGSADAQQKKSNSVDVKQKPPSTAKVPRKRKVTPGTVGGTENPYTTAPLFNSTPPLSEGAPGFRLTFPRR
jgi:hypothetical protein